MMQYGCPGLEAGFYYNQYTPGITYYPKIVEWYPEVKCNNWMSWFRKWLYGACPDCVQEGLRRGSFDD